jgi:tetratricopeptide (TPR) repeat protein
MLTTHIMEVPLGSRTLKLLLLISAAAIAAVIVWQAGQFWLARRGLDSQQLPQLENSVALVPGNGEVWDHLGRLRQWDMANEDLAGAVADYRMAVKVDPLNATYWIDLAGALEANGDDSGARQAFARAQYVYPKSADVAFNYGNFLLRHDDPADGYRQFQLAAYGDPRLLPLIVSRAWRSTENVNQLLDQILPQNADAYLQSIEFFRSIHQADPALTVWGRLMKLGLRFPLSRSFPLLDELIEEDRSTDARRVWREAILAAGFPYSDPPDHSLVWNGNFRSDFANGGLDWRWWAISGLLLDFDSEPGPNGSRAVRLDFSGGANLALIVPFQFVPVEPNSAYHFHAYMRAEQITSDSGLRFLVADPNHDNTLNLISDNFVGSHGWSPINIDFTTGPLTHFVLIRVVRYPSTLFQNQLGGTAWVADISLTPASGSQGAQAP